MEFMEAAREDRNIFLTGIAGTGKSHVLKVYLHQANYSGNTIAITASTGIAAVQISGGTLHSWSGIGLGNKPFNEIIYSEYFMERVAPRIINTDILVIEEVSMINSQIFTLVSRVCQFARDDNRPFGGMQVIVCGDMCQLPPVSKDKKVSFAFKSAEWWRADFHHIELTEPMRQTELEFLELLSDVRVGELGPESRDLLESRIDAYDPIKENACRLMSHNYQVDQINRKQLRKIHGKLYEYPAKDWFCREDHRLKKKLNSFCLSPKLLKIKIGAIVMATKNDRRRRFVNGSMGEVVDTQKKQVLVKFNNGNEVWVQPEIWEVHEFRGKDMTTAATREQLPIKLAWAITIHKSQGMSIDKVSTNLSKCFAAGQAYVSLSRCRSLGGLNIEGGIDYARIRQHPLAAKFVRGQLTIRK